MSLYVSLPATVVYISIEEGSIAVTRGQQKVPSSTRQRALSCDVPRQSSVLPSQPRSDSSAAPPPPRSQTGVTCNRHISHQGAPHTSPPPRSQTGVTCNRHICHQGAPHTPPPRSQTGVTCNRHISHQGAPHTPGGATHSTTQLSNWCNLQQPPAISRRGAPHTYTHSNTATRHKREQPLFSSLKPLLCMPRCWVQIHILYTSKTTLQKILCKI